jgi:hypothetical protein
MKTRLSIDTHFETYRAIIARTKNFISDDDFIVHRGDINNPAFTPFPYALRAVSCKKT